MNEKQLDALRDTSMKSYQALLGQLDKDGKDLLLLMCNIDHAMYHHDCLTPEGIQEAMDAMQNAKNLLKKAKQARKKAREIAKPVIPTQKGGEKDARF